MIIIQLIGGLGNQMFQYALGRKLSISKKVPLKMDISWYVRGGFGKDTKREYTLKNFCIEESFATDDEVRKIRGGDSFMGKLLSKVKNNVFGINVGFDEKLLHVPDDYYMKGHHQSEKYFSDIADVLQKEFSLKKDLSMHAKNIEEQIVACEAVSLHVRRGDYVTQKEAMNMIGAVDREYYAKAISIIKTKTKTPVFFVFSDGVAWVKENLDIDSAIYVSGEDISDYEELILMSRCKHNIVANSSFSWWGAWLNAHPKKIVIAPEKWFANKKMIAKDLIPETWTKI